jgi:hypothetical protein
LLTHRWQFIWIKESPARLRRKPADQIIMKLLFLFTLILSILLASRQTPLIPATWRLGSRRKATS